MFPDIIPDIPVTDYFKKFRICVNLFLKRSVIGGRETVGNDDIMVKVVFLQFLLLRQAEGCSLVTMVV